MSVTLSAAPSAGRATVSLKVRGGPATVTIEWFRGDAPGDLRSADGADSVAVEAGTGPVTLSHALGRVGGCHLSARVTTKPTSGEAAVDSILIPRCQDVPR